MLIGEQLGESQGCCRDAGGHQPQSLGPQCGPWLWLCVPLVPGATTLGRPGLGAGSWASHQAGGSMARSLGRGEARKCCVLQAGCRAFFVRQTHGNAKGCLGALGKPQAEGLTIRKQVLDVGPTEPWRVPDAGPRQAGPSSTQPLRYFLTLLCPGHFPGRRIPCVASV